MLTIDFNLFGPLTLSFDRKGWECHSTLKIRITYISKTAPFQIKIKVGTFENIRNTSRSMEYAHDMLLRLLIEIDTHNKTLKGALQKSKYELRK